MPSFDQEMSPLESGEAEPPQIRRPLTSPSDAERRRHETSHLPFREWGQHCVRGRGRAMPHFSRQRRGAEESVSCGAVRLHVHEGESQVRKH